MSVNIIRINMICRWEDAKTKQKKMKQKYTIRHCIKNIARKKINIQVQKVKSHQSYAVSKVCLDIFKSEW